MACGECLIPPARDHPAAPATRTPGAGRPPAVAGASGRQAGRQYRWDGRFGTKIAPHPSHGMPPGGVRTPAAGLDTLGSTLTRPFLVFDHGPGRQGGGSTVRLSTLLGAAWGRDEHRTTQPYQATLSSAWRSVAPLCLPYISLTWVNSAGMEQTPGECVAARSGNESGTQSRKSCTITKLW